MERILAALDTASHFGAIGTSGQVYPSAGFVEIAASRGAGCWEINLAPSGNPWFEEILTGAATEVVPCWCADMRAQLLA